MGKFMPPHSGHRYLVDFAQAYCDELWIFVCTLPTEPIPGELRFRWMQDLFPQARIVHIAKGDPLASRNEPGATQIWAQTVRQHLPDPVQFVFASESYGWEFAQALGAHFVPVDPSRDQFPISGTELRDRPFRNWHFIPHVVKPYFVKEIVIDARPFGEEIIRRTAMLLATMYVPSYRVFYQEFAHQGIPWCDLEPAQTAQRAALKKQSRFFLLRSFDPEITNGQADCYICCQPPNLDSAAIFVREAAKHGGQVRFLAGSADTAAHLLQDAILDEFRQLL